MLIFKEQIDYLGHLVSGVSSLPLTDKIEVLMELKTQPILKKLDISLVSRVTTENSYATTQTLQTH